MKHNDGKRFVVLVLWLIGISEAGVAARAGLRRKQVAGMVARSEWPNRSSMSLEERQAALEQLWSMRLDENGRPLDGGLLNNLKVKAVPLRTAQVRGRG